MGVGVGGVFSIMAYMGRLRPKGVPFSGFKIYKRVRISQVEVYKKHTQIAVKTKTFPILRSN